MNLDNSFMQTAYLKIGKAGIRSSLDIENAHNHQGQIWVTNNVLPGSYKRIRLESLPPVHL
jgi:hypothetical protein